MKKARLILAAAALAVIGVGLAANAGRWLIVDEAQPADVIVVLAGETDRRPGLALQLLRQGDARRVVLDVPADASIYGISQLKLAQTWVQSLPEAASVTVCPIAGLSTRDESHDVLRCLHQDETHILIVTSDFHTRRARSIFQHELHGKVFLVAAARDDSQFGARWWSHRQWAKTLVDEWLRLLWWNVVDRWR